MNQEKILKIIKGLNTFSLDDLAMMCDEEEYEIENILEKLISENTINKISDNAYIYVGKSKPREDYLKLVEASVKKSVKENSEITFQEAAEYFLEHHAKKNCKPATQKYYKTIIKTHLVQFFKNKKIKLITNEDIQKLIKVKYDEKLSPKMINGCVTLFGTMFSKFMEWGMISKTPYYGIVNIKYSKNQKVIVLSENETKILLKESKKVSEDLYLFILLALSTGLKKSEIMALKKDDIYLKNNTINVSKALSEGHFVLPRGNAAIRKVYAPKYILSKLILNEKDNGYIFYNTHYSAFTVRKLYRKNFVAILNNLGLPNIGLNDLRHTYAYNSLQSGMSIDYLHKQLGDYSIQATMDRYRDFISA
jgi:integrase